MSNKQIPNYFYNQMLFSLFGEIALTVIGLLYVLDCWFDSIISLAEQSKNNEEEKEVKMTDAVKRMYS